METSLIQSIPVGILGVASTLPFTSIAIVSPFAPTAMFCSDTTIDGVALSWYIFMVSE